MKLNDILSSPSYCCLCRNLALSHSVFKMTGGEDLSVATLQTWSHDLDHVHLWHFR